MDGAVAIALKSTQVGGVIIIISLISHDYILTGGWWYNNCMYAHLTGLHTERRSTIGGKQIYYIFGGEREISADSWSEAEMLLLPN